MLSQKNGKVQKVERVSKLGRSSNRIPPPLWEVDSSLVGLAEPLLGGGAKAASPPIPPIYTRGFRGEG